MMSLKVNWSKLCARFKYLTENNQLNELFFLITLKNGSHKRYSVKAKDFLKFIWLLSENKQLIVDSLFVYDKDGRIIYTHKTSLKEEIPLNGNIYLIEKWNSLSTQSKSTFLKILEAQIQSYVE